jgi:hypothetical protein
MEMRGDVAVLEADLREARVRCAALAPDQDRPQEPCRALGRPGREDDVVPTDEDFMALLLQRLPAEPSGSTAGTA